MFTKCLLTKVGLRTVIHLAVFMPLLGLVSQSGCSAVKSSTTNSGCDCDAITAEIATLDPTNVDVCRSVQLTIDAIDCNCTGAGSVDQATRDAAVQALQQFGCN